MKVSNCCNAPETEASELLGLCPRCHEHCDFEEEECDHEWELRDDSFDHEFGTERIPPYEICLLCDERRDPPELYYPEDDLSND